MPLTQPLPLSPDRNLDTAHTVPEAHRRGQSCPYATARAPPIVARAAAARARARRRPPIALLPLAVEVGAVAPAHEGPGVTPKRSGERELNSHRRTGRGDHASRAHIALGGGAAVCVFARISRSSTRLQQSYPGGAPEGDANSAPVSTAERSRHRRRHTETTPRETASRSAAAAPCEPHIIVRISSSSTRYSSRSSPYALHSSRNSPARMPAPHGAPLLERPRAAGRRTGFLACSGADPRRGRARAAWRARPRRCAIGGTARKSGHRIRPLDRLGPFIPLRALGVDTGCSASSPPPASIPKATVTVQYSTVL